MLYQTSRFKSWLVSMFLVSSLSAGASSSPPAAGSSLILNPDRHLPLIKIRKSAAVNHSPRNDSVPHSSRTFSVLQDRPAPIITELNRSTWVTVRLSNTQSLDGFPAVETEDGRAASVCMKPGQEFSVSDTRSGDSFQILVLSSLSSPLPAGSTECVLDVPFRTEVIDVRQLESSTVRRRIDGDSVAEAEVSRVRLPADQDGYESSFMLLLEEQEDGRRFIVIFTIDKEGKLHTHKVYLDNENDKDFQASFNWEQESDEKSVCSIKRVESSLFITCKKGFEDEEALLSPSSGEYSIKVSERGVLFWGEGQQPQILELPAFVRIRAFNGFGFKLMSSNKLAAIISKKPQDLRATISERWQDDSDFGQLSKLAEVCHELVKLSASEVKPSDPLFATEALLKQYWQNVPRLMGLALADVFKTVEALRVFKSSLGIGTPTSRVTVEYHEGVRSQRAFTAEEFGIQIVRDLMSYSLRQGYRDYWPAFVEMLFMARNSGVEHVVSFSTHTLVSAFYRRLQTHALWHLAAAKAQVSLDTMSLDEDTDSVRTEEFILDEDPEAQN